MIHYTLSLLNIPFFNITPNGTKHIHKKKKVILYNTFNIHENATLSLHILKNNVKSLKKIFTLCSFNDQKHV
jgi:hypothetical protein